MTVDEIKQTYSMSDILMRYGIKSNGIRKNISCPFHSDKNPSMQIFQDGYNCHSCGRNGDIFKFVQEIENCTFPEAFLSLGGEYKNTKEDFSAKIRLEAAKREREKRIQADLRRKRLKRELSSLISFYESYLVAFEPLSDIWCDAKNIVIYLLYVWEEKYIKGNEVDIVGIISRYSEFEFRRNIIRRSIS